MSEPGSSTLLTLRCPRGIDRRSLRAFAAHLGQAVAGGRSFNLLLTDDRELRRLNRRFLGRDRATDVLSFPSGAAGRAARESKRVEENAFLGDIAISAQRAGQQARDLGHPLEDEIRILMLHGLLHLLGMDHVTGRGAMARAETRWRKTLGLPVSLTERGRR